MDKSFTEGLPIPQRYGAILTIIIGIAMAVLDGVITNVALPTIASDLHVSPASSIWVVNAYQIAIVISLLSFAFLGDMFGYRRVYQCGLAFFTLTSFLCALSDSLTMLTLARIAQGFGGAALMSVNTALIRLIYPQRRLGRGMGINSFVVAVSSAAGPTIAAAILAVGSWQWLFLINVPLGIVALLLAMRYLPFFMQSVLGRSEVETGLLLTPWPLATMVMAPLAGYLIERVHAGLLGAVGLAIMAAGLLALALLPTVPSDVDIIWRMMLCGAGFGLFQSPNNHTIITAAPRQRSGGASGMLGTARLLGQSIGAALVALMFNLFTDHATHVALLFAAILAAVAAATSGLRMTQKPQA